MKKYFTFSLLLFISFTFLLGNSVQAEDKSIDLSNKKVGAMSGSTGETYIKKSFPDAKINSFDSINDAMSALSSNKLDYVITAQTTAINYTKNNKDLMIAQKDLIKENKAIATSKDNKELLDKINARLSAYKKDGTLKDITTRWTKTDKENYEEVVIPEADGPVLNVGVAANREPMCFILNNRFVGLDCELIQRIAYDLGMRVNFIDTQFSSLIASLQSKKIDCIISNMTPTKERKQLVNFSQTYFNNPQVLVSNKKKVKKEANVIPKYTKLSQLDNQKLGVITGSAYFDEAEKLIKNIDKNFYNDTIGQVEALRGGKIEGFIVDSPTARYIINKNKDLAMLANKLNAQKYGFAFAKGSALTPKVNEIIEEFKKDGTFKELEEIWFSADESKKKLPDLDFSQAKGTLKVAHESSLVPMSYVGDNGESLGFEVDMMSRIAHRLNLKPEFTSMKFESLIPAMVSGKYDVSVGTMAITPERSQTVDFSVPYYHAPTTIVVKNIAKIQGDDVGFIDGIKNSFHRNFVQGDRYKLILEGIGVTVSISIFSAIFGTLLGFGICMLKQMKNKVCSTLANIYIRIVQGTPIVVFLMILYYVIFGSMNIDAIYIAIIGFSINFSAYVSEMIRTGINAVEDGQIEAALALGFNKVQTFMKITFPQAAKHFLPVYKGEFISMVKMTSIVGYIAIQDLTKMSDLIRSRTYEAFFPLVTTAIIYFVIAYVLTFLLNLIEIRIDPKRRARKIKGVKVE